MAAPTDAGRPARPRWRRALRDPLLHFLVAGALLLPSDHWLGAEAARREIVVSAATRARLAADHRRQTGRDPDPQALQARVDAWVTDAILTREGLARGLDRGDEVVQRRVVSKLRLLLRDAAAAAAPTDAEVAQWHQAHPDRWAEPARLSFEHVFIPADAQGPAAATAAALLARLLAGEDPTRLGAPFPGGRQWRGATRTQVAASWSPAFADALAALPLAQWGGPVASPFGLHLVRVTARTAGQTAPLASVRARVVADLLEARRDAGEAAALRELRASYSVRMPAGPP
jgi:hypothetical protein